MSNPPVPTRSSGIVPSRPIQKKKIAFGKVRASAGHRTVLYGPGGIGKTTLASQAPGPVVWFDLDDSLPRLPQMKEAQVVTVDTWHDIRDALQSDGWEGVGTIVIDSITKAEEMAVAETLQYVPHEKGHKCQRLEDYGFGKGFQHVFDTFLPILADLDTHAHAGRNVVLICHDCTTAVPNPSGEDWLRYEPRLQNPSSGKASIRLRLREWADHVLFLGYDVIAKDGKGKGAGTRTLYPAELPHCMAKSRSTQQPIPITDGAAVWPQILL